MKLPKSASDNAFIGLGKNSEELKTSWKNFRSEVNRWDSSICIYLPKQDNIDSKSDSKDNSNESARDYAICSQDDGYDVIQTSSNFADIASFSGTKDRNFLKVASQIVRSIQVWQLLDATSRGDKTMLRGLIRRSVNMNLAGKTGQTSLLLSAKRGDLDLMKVLLEERQLDLGHQNSHGDTALHLAVSNNAYQETKREMILSLLRAGANPDIRNGDNRKTKQLVLVEGPLIQPRKRLKKSKPPGREGVKACQSVEMFVNEMYYTKDSKTLVPEKHWTMYKTVYNLIYAQRSGSVESMLDSERSENIKESEKPHCRWYHIPENNMVWVEDLFAQLLIEVDPWPSHYRGGKIPHSRCMNPEAVVLQNLDRNPDPHQILEGVAIMMPYISYESSRSQEAFKRVTRKLTQERKANLDDEVNSTITTLRDEELGNHGEENNLDHVDTSVTAGDLLSMESIPKITFMLTDSEGNNREDIDPQEGTDGMTSRGYEGLTKNDSLAVPQTSTVEGQDDFQAIRDATDSESDEENSNMLRKGPDITGVSDLLQAYLYHKPPLHPRRTLDQSYYYMLKNTSIRDSDQVVSRYARNNPDIGIDDHNVLMVDQLWIWYIKGNRDSKEPDTVITSFPNRQGAKVESSRDLDDLWYQVLANKVHQPRGVISSATDLIARVIEVCSGTLSRHQYVETLQFVQMFEATIGDAEDQETQMLQQFRRIVEELQDLDDHHPNYHQFRSEKLTKLLDIQNESGLLKDVKDARDEIKMIRAILTDQLKVLKNMNSPGKLMDIFASFDSRTPAQVSSSAWNGLNTRPAQSSTILLEKVYSSLEEINEEFEIMENHAKEVETSINGLMDLKQRQANLWEARSSREGAEETARQGNTILVFTIVTIIFLPLSFMASFFALAISQFPKDDKGDTQWPLHYVSGLMFGISFAVSIPLLLFAFHVGYVKRAWNYFHFVLLQECAILAIKPLRHIPIVAVRVRGHAWLVERKKIIRRYKSEGQPAWPPKWFEFRKSWQERQAWFQRCRWGLDTRDNEPELSMDMDDLNEEFELIL